MDILGISVAGSPTPRSSSSTPSDGSGDFARSLDQAVDQQQPRAGGPLIEGAYVRAHVKP